MIARTRKGLAAAVTLGITTAASAGCYGPPSCSDLKAEERKIVLAELDVAADGSFSIPSVPARGRFASCETFCAVESGVDTVSKCEGPTKIDKTWLITCDVEATECKRSELIGLPGRGRRPEGFCPVEGPAESLGDYFAFAAQLEAVSVPAFQRLERELAAHRAPRSLVRAARQAARDEVKHTRMMRALARHFGVVPEIPSIGTLPIRSLDAIAIENAVEGCVGETLGAIVATAQAEHATDVRIRRAMAIIAKDETEHAILAWQVHAWCMSRLDEAARTGVRKALLAATRAVDDGMVAIDSAPLRERAGLPDRDGARAMIAAAGQSLWTCDYDRTA
jgi:hypothetical protein